MSYKIIDIESAFHDEFPEITKLVDKIIKEKSLNIADYVFAYCHIYEFGLEITYYLDSLTHPDDSLLLEFKLDENNNYFCSQVCVNGDLF